MSLSLKGQKMPCFGRENLMYNREEERKIFEKKGAFINKKELKISPYLKISFEFHIFEVQISNYP